MLGQSQCKKYKFVGLNIFNLSRLVKKRHLHYEHPQQCFLINAVLSATKEMISGILVQTKSVLRVFCHIYFKRPVGKFWRKVICTCAQAFCTSSMFFVVQRNIIGRYLLGLGGSKRNHSLDGFYSASVLFINYLGLWFKVRLEILNT